MPYSPSASATALLFQCARPFGGGVIIDRGESSEAAKYGLAWHAVAAWALGLAVLPTMPQLAPVLEKAAADFGVSHLVQELEAHLFAALPKLFAWLDTLAVKDGDRIEILVEKSFALDVVTGAVREIENPTIEDHVYTTRPGEIPGTLDVAVLVWGPVRPGGLDQIKHVYIADHKTGEGDFSRPDRVPQILTLALMLYGFLKPRWGRRAPKITAGVFHAFRRGIAKMYTDEVSLAELKKHHAALKLAYGRIGDGTMRPGALCQHCPARSGCPAGDSELLVKAEALIKSSNIVGSQLLLTSNDQMISKDKKLGLLYEVIKNGEELIRRSREQIRTEIEGGALPEMSDGRVLKLVERQVERLSKKDFVTTYGKLAAERMFDKWRKEGAVSKKPEWHIQAVDD
jgi:hypothetical protein